MIHLREADERECRAGGWPNGAAALLHGMENSDKYYAVYLNEKLTAVWGYRSGSLFAYRCRAWLLTMPEVEHHRLRFTRSSVRVLRFLFEQFEEVEVLVHDQYIDALRWLVWLGFWPEGQHKGFITMVAKKDSWRWGS